MSNFHYYDVDVLTSTMSPNFIDENDIHVFHHFKKTIYDFVQKLKRLYYGIFNQEIKNENIVIDYSSLGENFVDIIFSFKNKKIVVTISNSNFMENYELFTYIPYLKTVNDDYKESYDILRDISNIEFEQKIKDVNYILKAIMLGIFEIEYQKSI